MSAKKAKAKAYADSADFVVVSGDEYNPVAAKAEHTPSGIGKKDRETAYAADPAKEFAVPVAGATKGPERSTPKQGTPKQGIPKQDTPKKGTPKKNDSSAK